MNNIKKNKFHNFHAKSHEQIHVATKKYFQLICPSFVVFVLMLE